VNAIKDEKAISASPVAEDYARENFTTNLSRNSFRRIEFRKTTSSTSFQSAHQHHTSVPLLPNLTNTGEYRMNFD